MASSRNKEGVKNITTIAMIVGVSLVVLAIMAQAWWSIDQDKAFTIETANKNIILPVRILEEHASRVLQDVSQTLYASKEDLKSRGDSVFQDEASARLVLSHQRRDSQFLYSLSLIDDKGMLWSSSLRFPIDRVDLSKQDQIVKLSEIKAKKNQRMLIYLVI